MGEGSSDPAFRARAACLCVALLGLVLAVFLQVRSHGFVDYDDHVYIASNPILEPGLGIEAVDRAFTRSHSANWIPLTWLSFLLDRALWGDAPAGYHLENVALHAASALVLFLALARATGALGCSAFVAAVFAIHPLHVESVAWAAERKDVLCGLFWMLGLLAWVYYAERPSPARWALAGLCVLLALLAKPIAVTLPGVLLLLDFWPLGRLLGPGRSGAAAAGLRRCVLEKLPFAAAAAGVAAVTWAVQRSGGGFASSPAPIAARVANALTSTLAYLADAFWPSGLAVIYPHPGPDWSPLAALGSGAVLASITWVAWRAARSHPWLLVGWLWYLVTLLPVIGLVQIGMHARADRYTYLPLVGLAIAVAWTGEALAGRARGRRRALALSASAAVASLAVAAWRQTATWRDDVALFSRALAVTERNFVAHYRLAAALARQGRLDEALLHTESALQLQPGLVAAHRQRASLLEQRGDLPAAIESASRALELVPDDREIRGELGLLLLRAGRFADAAPRLAEALARGADDTRLRVALGVARDRLGQTDAAIRSYREALRRDPGALTAANNLAWILATHARSELRDPAEAVRVAEEAVRRAGEELPMLVDTLAAAHAAAGRFPEAIAEAERAARLAAAQGDADSAAASRRRLALYREGRAYVDTGGGPEDGPPPR